MVRVAGSVTVFAPTVTAPAPVHVVLAFGVPAIDRPAGSVSVSAAVSEATLVFALVSVMVRVDVPPEAIGLVPKALATLGATAFTVSVLAVTPVASRFAVPVMLAALLVYAPPIAAVTSTLTWQLATPVLSCALAATTEA